MNQWKTIFFGLVLVAPALFAEVHAGGFYKRRCDDWSNGVNKPFEMKEYIRVWPLDVIRYGTTTPIGRSFSEVRQLPPGSTSGDTATVVRSAEWDSTKTEVHYHWRTIFFKGGAVGTSYVIEGTLKLDKNEIVHESQLIQSSDGNTSKLECFFDRLDK